VGYKRYVTNSVTILSQSVTAADTAIIEQIQTDVTNLSSSFSSSLIALSSSVTSSLSSLSSSFTSSLNSLSSSFGSSLTGVSSSLGTLSSSFNSQVQQPTVVSVGSSQMDLAGGNRFFVKTATGSLSWSFGNVPTSGAILAVLELTNGGTGTQTWPTGTRWPSGAAPTLTTSGVDVLAFLTDDAGSNWRGVVLMTDSK
jgi:hypothetical protein